MMKVSTRRRKGLPYHATLEAYNADTAIESEDLHGEQASSFRSGLGLALYMAMDRPDIQFAVKTLSSYMSRPTIKAMAALKRESMPSNYASGRAKILGAMDAAAERDAAACGVWAWF